MLIISDNNDNNQNEQYDHHQQHLIRGLLGRENLLTMSINAEEDVPFMQDFMASHPWLF